MGGQPHGCGWAGLTRWGLGWLAGARCWGLIPGCLLFAAAPALPQLPLSSCIPSPAGTITNAAKVLHAEGAREVYACATHAVFSPPAVERLSSGVFQEVIVANTIPVPPEHQFPELTVLSGEAAQLLGADNQPAGLGRAGGCRKSAAGSLSRGRQAGRAAVFRRPWSTLLTLAPCPLLSSSACCSRQPAWGGHLEGLQCH